MVWIIIALVLIAGFGPLLWALPSARERRIARLRARARQLRLIVQLSEVEDPAPSFDRQVSAGGRVLDPVVPCAAYRLAGAERAFRLFVRRRNSANGGELPAGWVWRLTPEGMPTTALTALGEALSALPGDVLAVEMDASSSAVLWRELGEASAVDSIHDWLQRLNRIG